MSGPVKISLLQELALDELNSTTDKIPILDVSDQSMDVGGTTKFITPNNLVGATLQDLAQTWDDIGTTFSGIKLNITDTASAANSSLLDLQVGGESKFKVRKDGAVLGEIEFLISASDEGTDLVAGSNKVTFRAPYPFKLIEVRANVNTAPTGANIVVDINNNGNSMLSTKLSIDIDEKTSTTAATPAVIDTTYDDVSDDAEITVDIDQVGSVISGKGLKILLVGIRA